MATTKTKRALSGAAIATGAAAAAAAGYYFYASKNAKQNRKVAAKWASGFKREALRQAKKLEKLDKATIARAVDRAVAAYHTVRTVERSDLEKAARELKTNWTALSAELRPRVKKVQKKVRKAAVKKTRR